jgi:hypothetical protein
MDSVPVLRRETLGIEKRNYHKYGQRAITGKRTTITEKIL